MRDLSAVLRTGVRIVDIVQKDDDLVLELYLVEDIVSGGGSGGKVGHVRDQVIDQGG